MRKPSILLLCHGRKNAITSNHPISPKLKSQFKHWNTVNTTDRARPHFLYDIRERPHMYNFKFPSLQSVVKNRKYDLVVSMFCPFGLFKSRDFWQNMASVIRKGGILVLQVPTTSQLRQEKYWNPYKTFSRLTDLQTRRVFNSSPFLQSSALNWSKYAIFKM